MTPQQARFQAQNTGKQDLTRLGQRIFLGSKSRKFEMQMEVMVVVCFANCAGNITEDPSEYDKGVPNGLISRVSITNENEALSEHARAAYHIDAVKIEAQLGLTAVHGGIETSFTEVISAQRKAFIGHLICMYWLIKAEMPHTTNFQSLIAMRESLDVNISKRSRKVTMPSILQKDLCKSSLRRLSTMLF